MKADDKSTEQNAELLARTESLDFYLKKIGWNLRSMTRQADVLETVMLEMKK